MPIRSLSLINISKDGSLRYVEDSVFPIKNNAGEITGFRGINRNVTEHRKTEDELKFRAELLDSATDSIYVLDLKGNFVYANEACRKSLGYTHEELLSMNVRNIAVSEHLRIGGGPHK